MLGVGDFLPVGEELAAALGDGVARAAVTVPGHDGAIACDLLLVRASDAGAGKLALVLAVREERTDLGAGLVRGLWYDAPVEGRACLRDGTPWLVEARVWRCCIAGALFADVRARERAAGTEDVASAWELRVLGDYASVGKAGTVVVVDDTRRFNTKGTTATNVIPTRARRS